jgi:hypothetical protein
MNSKNNDNKPIGIDIVFDYQEQDSVSIAHIAAVLNISIYLALEFAYPKEMRTICSGRISPEDIKDLRKRYLKHGNDLPF